MAQQNLSGTRVRERRVQKGLKQAELAQAVGISPSYLNLIEHNRRRIAGKLLVDIAQVLGIEPELLSQGADARLLMDLRDAAAAMDTASANVQRAEELAGKFPGWARVISGQHRKIDELDRRVAGLMDRFARDPFLFETLHEILSTVTGIRSAASLLAEPDDLNEVWRKRFSDNLASDSQRLSQAGTALSKYLEQDIEKQAAGFSPQEEFNQALVDHGFAFPEIETGTHSVETILEDAFGRLSPSAKIIALAYLKRYLEDAKKLPFETLANLVGNHGPSPAILSKYAKVPSATLLRRLVALPLDSQGIDVGLVTCDGTGTTLIRGLPVGFIAPRPQSACFDWPLYTAMRQPFTAIEREITLDVLPWAPQVPQQSRGFVAFAWCETVGQAGFDTPAQYESTMVVVRQRHG